MRRSGVPASPLLLRRSVLFLLLLPGVCPSTAGPTIEAPSKPATSPGGATAAGSTTEPPPLSPLSQAISTAGPVEASSPRPTSPQTPSHVGPWPAPVTKGGSPVGLMEPPWTGAVMPESRVGRFRKAKEAGGKSGVVWLSLHSCGRRDYSSQHPRL